jgi:hypothetical protein
VGVYGDFLEAVLHGTLLLEPVLKQMRTAS